VPAPGTPQSYKLLNISISNQIWRAPVAASIVGGMLVLLFNLLSCAILIRCGAATIHGAQCWSTYKCMDSAHAMRAETGCFGGAHASDEFGWCPAAGLQLSFALADCHTSSLTLGAAVPAVDRTRSKSIEKRGPGMGYGFVSAMCFTLAFFVLLCGLVLDGFRETVAAELETKGVFNPGGGVRWAVQTNTARQGHSWRPKFPCPVDAPTASGG
jgi:hypothetical protein